MKASDYQREFDKIIKSFQKKIKLRRFLGPIFKKLEIDIVRRTRLGFGARKWGGPKGKFLPLTEKYKKFRRKSSDLDTSRGSAGRSNLTFTGQMLKAFRIRFVKTGLMEIGFNETRNDDKTNSEIAGYHEGKGRKLRPFINPSVQEVKRFRQDIKRSLKKEIVKELKKLK